VRGLVVHQDARYVRNRELRIGLIIRATSCMLRIGAIGLCVN